MILSGNRYRFRGHAPGLWASEARKITGRLSDFDEVIVQFVGVAGGDGEMLSEHRAD